MFYRRKLVVPKAGAVRTSLGGSVLLAASAIAAAAWYEHEHGKVASADIPDAQLRMDRLDALREDRRNLDAIETGLRDEWGPFGLLGFSDIEEMAAVAGQSIYVARQVIDGKAVARGGRATLAVASLLALLRWRPDTMV